MRAKVEKPQAAEVSPLEESYLQAFQHQNQALPTRFDQSLPFFAPVLQNGAWVTARKYTTYATYGACEDPILAR